MQANCAEQAPCYILLPAFCVSEISFTMSPVHIYESSMLIVQDGGQYIIDIRSWQQQEATRLVVLEILFVNVEPDSVDEVLAFAGISETKDEIWQTSVRSGAQEDYVPQMLQSQNALRRADGPLLHVLRP